MPILKIFSIIAYALAAILFVASFVLEEIFFLPPAFTAIVAGVLFAAVEIIIKTLLEIRDALTPTSVVEQLPIHKTDEAEQIETPAKPFAAVSADLAALDDKIKQMRNRK